jgi:hypothetical protein
MHGFADAQKANRALSTHYFLVGELGIARVPRFTTGEAFRAGLAQPILRQPARETVIPLTWAALKFSLSVSNMCCLPSRLGSPESISRHIVAPHCSDWFFLC